MGESKFEWLRTQEGNQQPTRIPLSIYVLWHPSFSAGPLLARTIAEWCGFGVTDIRSIGLGIPVHFRSEPWTHEQPLPGEDRPPAPAPPGGGAAAERRRRLAVWRRPIDLDEADHNIFVVLVDDHLVDDASWRRDLVELARLHHVTDRRLRAAARGVGADADDSPHVHLSPIQVTGAWARMPDEVSRIQAVFLQRWKDRSDDGESSRNARWVQRVRRLLTQSLVRLLRDISGASLTGVYLSHAKMDCELGPGVAETLRDVAAGYGQIEVFYDENDLPSGREWLAPMERAASNTTGLLVVLSDAYATRFWCRREIQLGRTPAPWRDREGNLDPQIWTVRPTVVAVTLAGRWSRLIGDLGTVPAVLWRPEEEEQSALILDQMFREALLAEFHRMYAASLQRKAARVVLGEASVAFVTWTPDAASLVRLRKAAEKHAKWPERGQVVVYPGHGFLPTEEEDLDDSLGANVRFCSFEQFADALGAVTGARPWIEVMPVDDERHPKPHFDPCGPLLALSAGDADDLAALGYDAADRGPSDRSSLHVDMAVLRLCRAALDGGVRIAYGGRLRASKTFTSLLMDAVAALVTERPSTEGEPADAVADPETPLENWIGRPYEHDYPIGLRASLAGLCRFNLVGPRPPPDASLADLAVLRAEAMSEVRAGLAARTHATLALAGKRWGFTGIMPGVAEEVLCAMEHRPEVSVLLMGECGGAAREMVRYLLGTDPLPPALTLAGQLGMPHEVPRERLFAMLRERGGDPVGRYEALAQGLSRLRAVAAGQAGDELPALGLTVREWRSIMTTSSIGYVRRLLKTKVLPRLRERAAAAPPREAASAPPAASGQ